MPLCFFASDIHGSTERYRKLFEAIKAESPSALFLGGDLLPHGFKNDDYMNKFVIPEFKKLKEELGDKYPRVFMILGNDDGRLDEEACIEAAGSGVWEYMHFAKARFEGYTIYGYSYVPPTPFRLKDWERYDVSRYVDPGCVSPEEGMRTIPVEPREVEYSTIQKDLETLVGEESLDKAIFLFHTPPYQTKLDRAALDGKMIDSCPLDVHVGSIAVKRFIEERQPLLTLHGHIHESARITGSWRDQIGKTFLFSAAHDGKELALVRFDPAAPSTAARELV